jgi:pimeloyl-ACP methyl ester carboxylesterase
VARNSTTLDASWESQRVDVGGKVHLHCVLTGPCGGTPIVLLHGWPQFWYARRHQLATLSGAGYRAIAPDLRGFDLSDKPRQVSAYRISTLVKDVRGLVTSLGHPRVHLVGHDWGGGIAWSFAALFPDLVDRLVILNAPHPAILLRELRSFAQLKRSWYMFFFQLPMLPERFVTAEGFAARVLRGTSTRPEAFTDEDLARYDEAMRRPGAARATLSYYRAMFRTRPPPKLPVIQRPTLLIWGERDQALGTRMIEGTERYAPNLRVHRIPGASHWVGEEYPDEVSRAILAFVAEA